MGNVRGTWKRSDTLIYRREKGETKCCINCACYNKVFKQCSEKGFIEDPYEDMEDCRYYGDIVINPYHRKAPYNCPYYENNWAGEDKCRLSCDDCFYDVDRQCDEYIVIFGARWISEYQGLIKLKELKEE